MAMHSPNHNLNPTFPATLRKVYDDLKKQLMYHKPDREVLVHQDGLSFLGVWTGLRAGFDAHHLRRSIGDLLHLEDFSMVQIVGDSSRAFTVAGFEKAKRIVQDMLDDRDKSGMSTVIEYGYTASDRDANGIVNDLISSRPDLGARTVCNVVYMSAVAVEEWGSQANSNIANFVLAYDDDEWTGFGSDMWLSDSVMSPDYSDRLVCLEGGPQAFAQAVGVCLNGVSVTAVVGMRPRLDSSMSTLSSFSAAEMLAILQRELQRFGSDGDLSPEDGMSIKASMLGYLDGHADLQIPSNRRKYDLIKQSLDKLMVRPESGRVIEVIDLCSE